MKQRLAPFLVLLEARYAPLLFAVAPQAYAVYLWLLPAPYTITGEVFAVMGGLGYEFIYVGAIAWAEEGRWSVWTWVTAVAALIFSMLVAYHVYEYQVGWAWLHAGFPLVAFCYTLNMHTQPKRAQASAAIPQVEHKQITEVTQAPVQPYSEALVRAALGAVVETTQSNGHKLAQLPQNAAQPVLVASVAYPCPSCGAPLKSAQAKGAATRNGFCPQCKS